MANTGYKITQYIDDNPNSETYGEVWTERVLDNEHCPIGGGNWQLITSECEITTSGYTGNRIDTYYDSDTNQYSSTTVPDDHCYASSEGEVWIDTGNFECQQTPEGIYTGVAIIEQKQRNANLPNYGELRYVEGEREECIEHLYPIWSEISRVCHYDVDPESGFYIYDGTADVTQEDINPSSSGYGSIRVINVEDENCEETNCETFRVVWVYEDEICGSMMPPEYMLENLTYDTTYDTYQKYFKCVTDVSDEGYYKHIHIEYSGRTDCKYYYLNMDEYRGSANFLRSLSGDMATTTVGLTDGTSVRGSFGKVYNVQTDWWDDGNWHDCNDVGNYGTIIKFSLSYDFDVDYGSLFLVDNIDWQNLLFCATSSGLTITDGTAVDKYMPSGVYSATSHSINVVSCGERWVNYGDTVCLEDLKLRGVLNDGSEFTIACPNTTSTTSPDASIQRSEVSAYSSTLVSCEIDKCTYWINNGAFSGFTKLSSVTLTDSLRTISNDAFKNCTSLHSIKLPPSLEQIRGNAFRGTGLYTLNVPDSVTRIGGIHNVGDEYGYSFAYCTSLYSVKIGDGVTTIGYNCFYYCTSLRTVEIGKNFNLMHDNAFNGCTRLESITLHSTSVPSMNYTTALENTNDCPIYVLDSLVNDYKSANGWSTFASRIHGISEKPS